MNQPLVSILMTAYNRQQFIAEAIESVLASTYINWELIIVDDGSSDNTVAIAQSYATRDERIKLYVNEKNLGDYPNRNKAVSHASGKYLVWVDSDDSMFSDRFSEWIKIMEENRVAFGIFSFYHKDKPIVLSSEDALRIHFFKHSILSFGPIATITLRERFNVLGGFPVKYGPANDMYHHIKMACHGPILLMHIPLCNYRIHSGQEKNNTWAYLHCNYRYMQDALDELPLPLKRKEIENLKLSSKRLFMRNWFKAFIGSLNFTQSFKSLKLSKFRFLDFVAVVINKNL